MGRMGILKSNSFLDRYQWQGMNLVEKIFLSGETVNMIEDRDQLENSYPRFIELISAIAQSLKGIKDGNYRVPPFYKFPMYLLQLHNSFRRASNAVQALYGEGDRSNSRGVEITTMRKDDNYCYHDALHIEDKRYGLAMIMFGDPLRRATCVIYKVDGIDIDSMLEFTAVCNTPSELARSIMDGKFGVRSGVVMAQVLSNSRELVMEVDRNQNYRFPLDSCVS